jgi:hypothetical protein
LEIEQDFIVQSLFTVRVLTTALQGDCHVPDFFREIVFKKHIHIPCEKSIFEKVFIWFLGEPVVWSEPNISQIEA